MQGIPHEFTSMAEQTHAHVLARQTGRLCHHGDGGSSRWVFVGAVNGAGSGSGPSELHQRGACRQALVRRWRVLGR